MIVTTEFKKNFLRKVLRNTFSAIGVRILLIIISILLIPFMIAKMGKQEFGILALMGAVTGYVGLLDVGFNSAFIKYISEHFTRGETEKINQIINSGFVFYIMWSGLIIILSYFFLKLFLFFFHIPENLIGVTIFAFWFSIATICVNNIFLIFGTVLSGLQRIDIEYFWFGIVNLARSLGIVFILLIGMGIGGVVVVNFLSAFFMSGINVVLCKRLFPDMHINFKRYFDWRTVKKLFNFGYKLQISGISTIIFNNVDKILIGRFYSLDFVTFYQIGSRILEKIKAIPQMFFAALLPGFSEIDALENKTLVLKTFRKSAKLIGLIFLPLLLIIVSASHSIILLWVGPGFENAAYVIRILGIGYSIFLFLGLGYALSTAIGKVVLVMYTSIIQSISNIVLSILFMYWFGFKGVVFGTTISSVLSFIYLTLLLSYKLQANLRQFFSNKFLLVILSNIVAFVCTVFVGITLNKFFIQQTRVSGFIIAASQTVCFLIIFVIIQIFTKPLYNEEVDALSSRFRLLKPALKILTR